MLSRNQTSPSFPGCGKHLRELECVAALWESSYLQYDGFRRQVYCPNDKRGWRTTDSDQETNQFLAATGKRISEKLQLDVCNQEDFTPEEQPSAMALSTSQLGRYNMQHIRPFHGYFQNSNHFNSHARSVALCDNMNIEPTLI